VLRVLVSPCAICPLHAHDRPRTWRDLRHAYCHAALAMVTRTESSSDTIAHLPRPPERELFLGAGESAYATHYRAGSTTFAIVVPPLFEELARTRKVLVNMARVLAESGIDAIRFDYPGTGLSPGTTDELTLAAAAAALRDAVAYARDCGAKHIHLLGFRFGAYVALHAGIADARLVLWEPVLDLAAYFRELLRVEVSNQVVTYGAVRCTRDELVAQLRAGQTILVDGNRITPSLCHELDAAPRFDVDALAALGDRVRIIVWESRALEADAARAGIRTALVEGVRFSWKHIRTLEPRSAALFAATQRAIGA
jgi:alpha/beta superfamily hydrolase